jgi:DNA-binding HxlR family transcriptional regulator
MSHHRYRDLVVIDDYVVGISAAVTTASLIVLVMLLARYRMLVGEMGRSAQLAKNIWDAMNSRFSITDARIIDLMAKVDVYSVRNSPNSSASIIQPPPVPPRSQLPVQGVAAATQDQDERQSSLSPAVAASRMLDQNRTPAATMGEETEVQILRTLSEGPKTSSQIKEVIGRSREHTARLMKALFEHGLVVRNDRNKPYVYELTESGKSHLSGS